MRRVVFSTFALLRRNLTTNPLDNLAKLEEVLIPQKCAGIVESENCPVTIDEKLTSDNQEPVFARSKYKPKEFLRSYTFGPYANETKVLRYLVDMGVDLSSWELKPGVADFVLKLNWKKDVVPVLKFLIDLGVPLETLPVCITKNPWIFQQTLDQLHLRVAYLKSKQFSNQAIANVVYKARYWLNFDVEQIDKRLGWYQRQFDLTGDQVRLVVEQNPKLITFGTGYTQVLQLKFSDMGFKREEIKQLLIKDPKLFTHYSCALQKSFDYLHNGVGFSHATILQWPRCLREPKYKIRARHEWLRQLNRHQYDACKANYVSLQSLLGGSDEDFCFKVAKCPVRAFDEFLKLQ